MQHKILKFFILNTSHVLYFGRCFVLFHRNATFKQFLNKTEHFFFGMLPWYLLCVRVYHTRVSSTMDHHDKKVNKLFLGKCPSNLFFLQARVEPSKILPNNEDTNEYT